jgi:hypothetical protein
VRYFPSVRGSALYILGILGILGMISISPAYAQYEEMGDQVMGQMKEGVETGISSIEVPEDNLIDTNQEEVDSLAHSLSEWLESLFNFGRKTHHVTEDAMAVAAPSWVDPIIIALVAGAVVVFIMWKVIKKVGIHLAIGMGFLAAVIVFLMLLDLNS